MIGIYKITNNINGKVYIGQSVDIEKRWKQHISASKNNNGLLYKAMRKYGIHNFSFEVVEECEVEELNEKENYYIEKYNSCVNIVGGSGYNVSLGGTSIVHSKTTLMNNDLVREIIEKCDIQTAMFYMILLSHRNPVTNECRPSLPLLSEELDTSVSTVQRAIRKLYSNDFLIIDSGKQGMANRYYFPKENFYNGEGATSTRRGKGNFAVRKGEKQ